MNQLVFRSRPRTIAAAATSILAAVALFGYIASAPAKPGIDAAYESAPKKFVAGVVTGDLDGIEIRMVFLSDGDPMVKKSVKLSDDGRFRVAIPDGAVKVRIVVTSPQGKLVGVFEIRPGQTLRLNVRPPGGGGVALPLPVPY